MMKSLLMLVAINFMLLLLTSSIVSHPLTNMPIPAEDADITSFFPTNTDHKFPIGGLITSLCHFSNEGLSNYNITAIMGSLNAPYDFKHHFQNYSYKSFNYIVKSGNIQYFIIIIVQSNIIININHYHDESSSSSSLCIYHHASQHHASSACITL